MRALLRSLFFLALIRPFLCGIMGMNVFGRANLPRGRQFILIANHNSHLDALVLLSLFPLRRLHRIHPVAAEDYFMQNRLLAWFTITFLNIVPIPRSGFTRQNNPLTRMGEILEAGESLIIFPEGSRGEPEEMSEFKSGIAHIIQKYPEIPVVPVFLKNLGRALPKGDFVPVPFYLDVAIGPARQITGSRDEIVRQAEQAVREARELLP